MIPHVLRDARGLVDLASVYKTACTQTISFLIVINSVSFAPDYTRSLSSFSSIVTMSLSSLIIYLSLILTMSLSSPISSLIIFSVSSPQQQCHCHEYDSVNGSVCVAGTWYVFNVSDSVFWSTLWLMLCVLVCLVFGVCDSVCDSVCVTV